ncbi:hypothetical protein C5167_050137 [Papaver somniferum]|uniref:Amine oxidase domain-containing protein n=1 Tax=Papaver somniferum TaxID=3469 RepID=A0A4Y7KP73_PAPSO|nr:hypothetical protein C5167_050137 [Papaver somniferum]
MAESIKPGSVKSVAVVGGGVSGLAAAYKLKSQGINVTVFEAEEKAGGKLRSVSRDGLIWDEGANKMPISQNKRYVVKDGAPTLIPSNPIALIASSLLSTKSKPLLWRSPAHRSNQSKMSTEYSQESVREFFQRHFGEEVVEYLVDPFVAGTSAGDADSLSRLTDMLSKDLGDDLKLKSKVLSLSYNGDDISSSNNWSLSYATNQKTGEPSAHQSFDAVIMTAPLCNVKEMKIKTCGGPFILDFIPKITYLPLSVVITAYRKQNVKRPLEGFGVLVPTKEQQNGLKTLGKHCFKQLTT